MKFCSPDGSDIHLATTDGGHTFVVGAEPVEVPQKFLRMAMAKGCLPEGMAPEQKPAITTKSKGELVDMGVRRMLDAAGPDDLTGDGKPKLDKLSALVGFMVAADERDTVLARIDREVEIEAAKAAMAAKQAKAGR